jgi:hypothetical protein
MDNYFILIDLVLGRTFLREYPIGECVECGDNCDPRVVMCNRCHAIEDKATEIRELKAMFNNNEIILP